MPHVLWQLEGVKAKVESHGEAAASEGEGHGEAAGPEFEVMEAGTLSAEEYHTNSWTREDCLTCHQQGVQNAPRMRHVSLPEIAASAKCRTCHVLVADEDSP